MTEIHKDSPEGFSVLLRAFYDRCDSPSYRVMESDSDHLAEYYPGEFKGREVTPLTRSVIGEVLNGKRLPSASWLTSFLLICQRRGYLDHALPEDRGPAILAGWMDQLRRAR